MSRRISRRTAAGLILLFIMTILLRVPVAAAEWPDGSDLELASDAAVVIDARSGVVLYELNKDEKRFPASVTKVMTTYLALTNGKLTDMVTVTEEAVAYAVGGSANQRTQEGEIFTLEELLYGTMLASANDMATAVGVHIGGGSIENFAEMMNAKAEELGCRGTHFVNACGMPDDDHYTTAYDMALVFQAALKNNDFRKIINTHSYTIPPTNKTETERSLINHDPLLTNPSFAYPGIIGGKTGNTDAAGQTLVNGVNQNGMELIAVTMRAPDAPSAAEDHVRLFDYAYANYTVREVGMSTYRASGGFISLPKGAETEDCDVTVSEDKAKKLVTYTYTYKDRYAGEMVMTKENERLYLASLEEADGNETEESRKTDSGKAVVTETSDGNSTDEDPASASSPESGNSGLKGTVSPEPEEKEETSFLRKVLIVLAILVAVGFCMVLISIHLTRERRRRYKLRRKRKRGRRG